MISRFLRLVEEGQFIHVKSDYGRVQPDLRLMWWKVTAVRPSEGRLEGVQISLVNRHGNRRQITARPSDGWKAIVWEPGDDRNDMQPQD